MAAWGWGASRIIDCFETDPQISARRVAITGASHLWKTVLWAGQVNEAPFDAQMIVALIAPRAVHLQTGNTDILVRPYGEFLAATASPARGCRAAS